MAQRLFGHVLGYPVGSHFASRPSCRRLAYTALRWPGYREANKRAPTPLFYPAATRDDTDSGDEIVYTGRGGRDEATQRQIADQDFRYGNRALAHSSLHGLPVRVIRGWRHRSPHSPSAGYRYDGLYLVDDYWQERGRSGFLIWRYKLVKLPEQLDQERVTNH